MNLTQIIDDAVDKADNNQSKLSDEQAGITGFSSTKIRHLYNNIVSTVDKARYLEVGLFTGSTFVAALWDNSYECAWGFDNWSQLWGWKKKKLRNKFYDRMEEFNLDGKINIIEQDFFKDAPSVHGVSNVNVYMYDALHTKEAQYNAITHVKDILADQVIIMIDDSDRRHVFESTDKGIATLPHKIVHSRRMTSRHHTRGPGHEWWEGVYIIGIER